MRKLTLPLLTLLLSLFFASPVLAQNWLRSLSNAFGGGNQPAPAQGTSATATIGVRGIQPIGEAIQNATPATDQLKLADSWAASKNDASGAAARSKLSARTVTLRASSRVAETAQGESQ